MNNILIKSTKIFFRGIFVLFLLFTITNCNNPSVKHLELEKAEKQLVENLKMYEKITLLTKESDVSYHNARINHLKANLSESFESDICFDLIIYLAGVAPYGNFKNKPNTFFYNSNVNPLFFKIQLL